MNRRIKGVLGGLCFVAMTGCQSTPTPPSEEDAQTAWHHIADQTRTSKLVELVSLKRTSGQMQDIRGTKVYTLFYEAKIRYRTPVGHWKTGDIQTIDSNYGFQRTENGWQGPDGAIYTK